MRITIEVDVCNVCRDPERPVEPFAIRLGEDELEGHLCATDAQPLRAILTHRGAEAEERPESKPAARKAPARKRAAKKPARPRRSAIVTPEELEELKAKGLA